MTIFFFLLALPAALSVYALVRDLRGDLQAAVSAPQMPPRSRPDEQQTRTEVLAYLSR